MPKAVSSVLYWLFTFVSLCFYGVFVIGIGSLGNHTECRRWWMPVLAIISIFTIFILSNVTTRFDKSKIEYDYLKIVSVILASCVIFLHVLHLLSLIIPDSFLDTHPSLSQELAHFEPDGKRTSDEICHGLP
jgi:MFS-type transporter involved in bile tolerance (Atg22 family)